MIESETRAAMTANQIAVNNAIIGNPEVWVRGNEGQELSPAEMAIYSRLINNLNDHLFHQARTLPLIDPGTEEQVLAMLAGFLHDNPGAHLVWLEREHRVNFYRTSLDPSESVTNEWIDVIESRIAKLEIAEAR